MVDDNRKSGRRKGLGRTRGGRRKTSSKVETDRRMMGESLRGRRNPGSDPRKQSLIDPIDKFWAHGKDLQEEHKFRAALNQLLKEFRKNLDDSSKLAKSIDNKESSTTMVKVAVEEDCFELAEILLLDSKR